jgi:beta-lactamase regulating signal transducer with metallopeptidase domain
MDNLWRVAAIVIVCFHWFNPFAWLLLKYFFQDMELSCDEKAIRNLKPAERKHYAEALLRFAGDKGFVVSTAFGKSNVKVRIVNVLNFKKLTTIGIVTSILFLLVISLLFITNPSF